jgi:hypothetical protein
MMLYLKTADCKKVSQVGQSVLCLATGLTIRWLRFDPQQRQKDFFSNLCVQTGSGAHPASCTLGTGGPFPGAKAWLGRDADHGMQWDSFSFRL